MTIYKANLELLKVKEVYKGEAEWEKGFTLFQCLLLRDRKTAEHSLEVAYYASLIAAQLGLDQDRYFLAGLLHDIGKMEMNDHPLKSDKKLKNKERKKLHNHVIHGVLFLSEFDFGKDIIQFCLRHHERLNGSGYPFSIKKEDIGVEGRIAMIADVFSAMTSDRAYRTNNNAYSEEDTLKRMKAEAKQDGLFDRKLLKIFEKIITEIKHKDSQLYA